MKITVFTILCILLCVPFVSADWQVKNNEDLFTLGNVGIGVSTPTKNLDVQALEGDATLRLRSLGTDAVDDTQLFLQVGNTDANNWILFGDSEQTSSGYIRYAHKNDKLLIGNGGKPAVIVDSSQNVGVGVGSPQSSLHVHGDENQFRITDGGFNSLIFNMADLATITSTEKLVLGVEKSTSLIDIDRQGLFIQGDSLLTASAPVVNLAGNEAVSILSDKITFQSNDIIDTFADSIASFSGEVTINTDDYTLTAEDVDLESTEFFSLRGEEITLQAEDRLGLSTRDGNVVLQTFSAGDGIILSAGSDNTVFEVTGSGTVMVNVPVSTPKTGSLHIGGDTRIDEGKLIMQSDDGTHFECGPSNTGEWECSPIGFEQAE